MTRARIILGEVFVAILVFAVLYAAAAPIFQPMTFPTVPLPWFSDDPNMETERYSFIKGANVSQNVNQIDLNLTLKFGGVYVAFSDQTNLALEAVFQHSPERIQLSISSLEAANQTRISASGDTGSLNLTLGKDFQLSGTLDIRIGGLIMTLGQHASVSKFETNIRYFGGVVLTIGNGASFEELDYSIEVGGAQINFDAQAITRNGKIDIDTRIGGVSLGVDVNTTKIGVSLEAIVDIGGVSVNHLGFLEGSVSSTYCSVKTLGYDTATNKIDLQCTTGLGGVTLQENMQNLSDFEP